MLYKISNVSLKRVKIIAKRLGESIHFKDKKPKIKKLSLETDLKIKFLMIYLFILNFESIDALL